MASPSVCVCIREVMKYTLHRVWWTESVFLVCNAFFFLRAHICSSVLLTSGNKTTQIQCIPKKTPVLWLKTASRGELNSFVGFFKIKKLLSLNLYQLQSCSQSSPLTFKNKSMHTGLINIFLNTGGKAVKFTVLHTSITEKKRKKHY